MRRPRSPAWFFVAVSIQLRVVAANDVLRHRATSSLVFLFTIVAGSAAILAPQSPRAVGAEFLALVGIGGLVGRKALFGRELATRPAEPRAHARADPHRARRVAGDISLIIQRGYGLSLAAPCLVITAATTVAAPDVPDAQAVVERIE